MMTTFEDTVDVTGFFDHVDLNKSVTPDFLLVGGGI